MITVYLDGKILKMTLEELIAKNYNVLVNKTNGYSHDWQEVVKFDPSLVQYGIQIWCTIREVGFVYNSSVVSFS